MDGVQSDSEAFSGNNYEFNSCKFMIANAEAGINLKMGG